MTLARELHEFIDRRNYTERRICYNVPSSPEQTCRTLHSWNLRGRERESNRESSSGL